jgi:type II secretory pathway component PulF
MIVTPGQLTQRAEFYHQLAQLTGAGIGLIQSLDQLFRHPPSRSYRQPIHDAIGKLNQGMTLTEAFSANKAWLPSFDLTLIEAGEKSGRLDYCFRMLAEHYSERATNAKQMISSLIYPAFLLHFLVIVMILVFYLWAPRLLILPLAGLPLIYAIVGAIVYAGQNKHGENWRSFIESVLHPVPVLGSARHCLALARLAAALEALIGAGVTIIEAWEMAAAASDSPGFRRTVDGWRPLLLAGRTPAEVLQTADRFPELFKNQYAAGEISGRLDDSLRRLRNYYQDEGSRKLKAVARWVPIIIYLMVAISIGIFVVWFYTRMAQTWNNF